MTFDLGFWKFAIILSISKTFLFCKDDDIYFFHIGLIGESGSRGLKIVFLPVNILFGIKRNQ
ncbi:hypothetical protein GD1_150 [Paraglaciecola Antarctic GD virus 1]|nr:hypothetical protein GD1_150 [Paraglaciecola Antarctic GD virus 1]